MNTNTDKLAQALRKAFNLGQRYWQQADSESYAQNRKAGTTQQAFEELLARTIADHDALAAQAEQQAPAGFVNIPSSREEAEAMLRVSTLWLHAHGGAPKQAEQRGSLYNLMDRLGGWPVPEVSGGRAEQQAGPGWQSIETAPKDRVVLLAVDGEVHAGCWFETPFRELRDSDGLYVDQHDAQAFWCAYVIGECEPTHWTTLPAAPGATPEPVKAEQQAGPVATVTRFHDLGGEIDWTGRVICPVGTKLYTHPSSSLTAEPVRLARLREQVRHLGYVIRGQRHELRRLLGRVKAKNSAQSLTAGQEQDKVDAERINDQIADASKLVQRTTGCTLCGFCANTGERIQGWKQAANDAECRKLYQWLIRRELPEIMDLYHQSPEKFDGAIRAARAKEQP